MMRDPWKQARRWAFLGGQRVITEAAMMVRSDRRRRIDAVIDYFGGAQTLYGLVAREQAPLGEHDIKDRGLGIDASLDRMRTGSRGREPVRRATRGRARKGKVLATDGPFAETKEQMGGGYVIASSPGAGWPRCQPV
jgi:hypothetical protein